MHLFQRNEAIPVVIKQRESGASLVVAGASAQNGQPARKLAEIDHTVAIVIEQIKQTVNDTERRRFFRPTQRVVSLFAKKESFGQLKFLLPVVFRLLEDCIVHPNQLLARKGVACLKILLVDAGGNFDPL